MTPAAIVLLVLGSSVMGAIAAPAKRVPTTVTIKFTAGPPPSNPYQEPEPDRFSGRVKAQAHASRLKRKCRSDRSVNVKRVGGATIVTDTTNRRGRYGVSVANAPPGQYVAKAKIRRIRHNGKRVVCQADKSDPVTVSS